MAPLCVMFYEYWIAAKSHASNGHARLYIIRNVDALSDKIIGVI